MTESYLTDVRLRLRLTGQREVGEVHLREVIGLRNQIQVIRKRQLRLRRIEHVDQSGGSWLKARAA